MSQYCIIIHRSFLIFNFRKFIPVQKNLKYFGTILHRLTLILSKLPDTLVKLEIYAGQNQNSDSFLTKLVNSQELEISSSNDRIFEDLLIYNFHI